MVTPTSTPGPTHGPSQGPTLRTERALLRAGAISVACLDEVGRGALSGPVTLGAVLITPDSVPAPSGVRDSKLLTATQREALRPLVVEWASAWALPRVVTMVKADQRCSGVAAASILAKTARDRIMIKLHEGYPEYGWAQNKGYGSSEHLKALARLGPTPHHRMTWSLPAGP